MTSECYSSRCSDILASRRRESLPALLQMSYSAAYGSTEVGLAPLAASLGALFEHALLARRGYRRYRPASSRPASAEIGVEAYAEQSHFFGFGRLKAKQQ